MVHQYQNNGYNIVLDVNSGLVHVVDDLAYDVIALYESEDKETLVNQVMDKHRKDGIAEKDVWEALDEVEDLIREGALFSKDVYEEMDKEFQVRETVVKALCLHVAHDCNLRCQYCFAKEGEYQGERSLMSSLVGKKAIDFLIENSGNRRNLEVDFFGGEPLLNLKVVKEVVAYGRSLEKKHGKAFRFTLTTNGVLLRDEDMEFIHREMSNVVLSLDGRKEVHDAMRPTANGKGSYDIVVSKMKEFVKLRKDRDYYVRGTFTRNNKDFVEDVLHLADMGFQNISMEPVVADGKEGYSIREEDLPEILKEYDRLAKIMLERRRSPWKKEGKGFHFFHFHIDLNGGPCLAKRLSGCGSGTEYLAVTPTGDLYPCHQFVGKEEFLMGNVLDGGVKNVVVTEEWKGCNVYTKRKCRDCFAKFYCSGGCLANAYQFHGTINDVYEIGCKMQKKRVECAIMLKAAMQR